MERLHASTILVSSIACPRKRVQSVIAFYIESSAPHEVISHSLSPFVSAGGPWSNV